MQKSLETLLNRYLQHRTPAGFLQLQEAVAALPDYDPYAGNYGKEASELFQEEKFEAVVETLISLMPNWFLNPGIHKLLSLAYHQLGQQESARLEYTLAIAFVEGILATGDGSEGRPYRVLHTADEYDVLEHLGKEPHRQSLVEKENRYYDRQECQDGPVWFDVTIPYSHLRKQLKTKDEG